MNLTYFNDGIYLDGEKLEVEKPAEVYAEMLVNAIANAMEYSPMLQREFFERLRPTAAAYYDWRIMPMSQWQEVEAAIDEIIDDDDEFIDDDDIYDPDPEDGDEYEDGPFDVLLDNLLQIRVSVNALIDEVAKAVYDDDCYDDEDDE